MTDKKTETAKAGLETKPVVELLTSILAEVKQQVAAPTPPAQLDDAVAQAVDLFQQIVASLALQQGADIVLTADPTELPVGGGTTRLTWSSIDAQSVVIDQGVGKVAPPSGGTIAVNITSTTTFTASAINPCGPATATVTVTVTTLE